ncbi:MAG TPA: hypothetical protein DEB06_05425 [Phycisphaerales bacterium]|nr:hypothetical protein [Phycisphaerales bacterium]
MPLFPAEVARLEEPRGVADLTHAADISEPILGGVMARSAPGVWTNHALGLCMDQPADGRSLDHLVGFYADHAIEPRVEVCPMADESLLKGLASRGFVLKGFESVLARALESGDNISALVPPPGGLSFDPIDPADDAALREYCGLIYRAFFPAEHPGPSDADMGAMLRFIRRPGTIAVRAIIEGRFIGGGSVTVSGPVASLAGAAVIEPFRRRGVQQHLLAHRLRLASRAGARIATIGSKPGVATERNVLRMGFTMAYTRAILVRPGEGLVGEPG